MFNQSRKQVKATPNHSKRTFTLRVFIDSEFVGKYRTITLPKDEFNSCLYNTNNDWLQFLKSDDYYTV